MIKYCNLYLPSRLFVVISLDAIVIAAAMLLSIDTGTEGVFPLPSSGIVIGFAVAVCLGCLYLCNLYDFDALNSGRTVLLQSLRAVGIGILLLAPIWLTFSAVSSDYRIFERNFLALVIALCGYRLFASWLHHRILPGQRILLIGSGTSVQLLASAIQDKCALPLMLRGIVPAGRDTLPASFAFAACGDLRDLSSIAKRLKADRIAVCSDLFANSLPADELLALRSNGIRIDDAAALYEAITGRVPVKLVRTAQMTFGRGFPTLGAPAFIYRVCSILFAVAALILAAPLLLFLALLIKLGSRGPVLYKQERVGVNGKTFLTLKFRSMRTDAESLTGPVWASDDDPRITRVGKILRLLRLDELPQLWNVLRGDMNLVGPRPERPHFVSMLNERIPYYNLRHSIPPGITGWAQVCASYGANVEDSREKLEYDLFYLKNRSLLLDCMIVVKTIKIMISGKGAR